MRAELERGGAAQGPTITGFRGDAFVVEGEPHEALLLTPERFMLWRSPPLEALTIADLAPLLELEPLPEFILLGAGGRTRFPPPALAAALDERGVGVEAMDSRTAARTWSLLRGEGRWIAAALLPIAGAAAS